MFSEWFRILHRASRLTGLAAVLCFCWLAESVNATVINLSNDRSRYDLQEFSGGEWRRDWTPEMEHAAPPGQLFVPNAGWSDEIFHWRGTLNNESEQTNWFLVVRNPSVDLFRVYIDLPDTDQFIQLSDYQAPGQRLFPSNHFVIPIQIEPDSRQTLYITATSDDWQFYPLMLVDQTGYQTFAQQEMLAIGAITGLLLALFIFNLIQTMLKGHWSFVWVAISAIAWILQLWYWYGLGYLWIWPQSPWLQNHLWYLLLPITGLSLLASVIAALGAFLGLGQKVWLYALSLGGFLGLMISQLILPNGLYLSLNWLWFTLIGLCMLYWLKGSGALISLHALLLGYSLVAGVFFLYMAWSPVLHTTVLMSLALCFIALTSMHSFVVYWQYRRNQQKAWQVLKERSQAFEDAASKRRALLDHYRLAARMGLTWRNAFTDNIRQRFQSILTYNEQLRQTVVADDRQTLLKKVAQAGEEGQTYLDDLVTMEELLSEEYRIDYEPIQFNQWLLQFEDWFEQAQVSSQVFFRAVLQHADLPTLMAPSEALRTILFRFLDNSLKYTDSGFIKLLVDAEGQTRQRINCRFQIRDSGTGLADAQVARIRRFWAEGTPPPKDAASESELGSGFIITLLLLRQLGARFDIQSSPEAGTSIRFWLCLDREQDHSTPPAVEHWLIVDPAATLYDEARHQLNEAVDILWVKNGQVAQTALRDGVFDVIILNMDAPMTDGIEFTRLCRRREDKNRNAWIIGTHSQETAVTTDQSYATQAGMNQVSIKPVDEAGQKAWITRLIQQLYRSSENNEDD